MRLDVSNVTETVSSRCGRERPDPLHSRHPIAPPTRRHQLAGGVCLPRSPNPHPPKRLPGNRRTQQPARQSEIGPRQCRDSVSGYSETDAVKRTAPDAPLLAKPFRAEALDKAVRAALASHG